MKPFNQSCSVDKNNLLKSLQRVKNCIFVRDYLVNIIDKKENIIIHKYLSIPINIFCTDFYTTSFTKQGQIIFHMYKISLLSLTEHFLSSLICHRSSVYFYP
jgi:hypothetical protein